MISVLQGAGVKPVKRTTALNDSNSTLRLDEPRAARRGELDAVLDLANEVMRVEKGFPPSIAVDYPFIYNDANLENIVIFGFARRLGKSSDELVTA